MIRLNNVSKYYPTPKGRKYVFRALTLDFPEKKNKEPLFVLRMNK